MRLPGHRAFLVRLSDQSDTGLVRVTGRVEHVETGLGRSFATYDELRDFMAGILATESTEEDEQQNAWPASGL